MHHNIQVIYTSNTADLPVSHNVLLREKIGRKIFSENNIHVVNGFLDAIRVQPVRQYTFYCVV